MVAEHPFSTNLPENSKEYKWHPAEILAGPHPKPVGERSEPAGFRLAVSGLVIQAPNGPGEPG